MEIRIRKHGLDYESFKSNSPVKIILSNGAEFDISEDFEELLVNCTNELLDISPNCANQVCIKERK